MTEKHFIDWFSNIFPYGYGDGEEHYIRCLKQFFSNLEDGRIYDYEKLESVMGKAETWFIINELCKCNIIDYGTSPRFAWIQDDIAAVAELRDFIVSKTEQELYDLVMVGQEYHHCMPDYCNCNTPCNNPLFKIK